MARAGRELEILVAKLEDISAEFPVRINSPDSILGRKSGVEREVDVAIRGSVASVELLVIFECRDRKAIQDVTWIEQLASKSEDLQANKAVAVSSSGFSKAAKSMAASHGIVLRTLAELTESDVNDWIAMSSTTVRLTTVRVLDTEISCFENTPPLQPRVAKAFESGDIDTLPLVTWPDGHRITIEEVFEDARVNSADKFGDLYEAPGSIEVSGPDHPTVGIPTKEGFFPLAALTFVCEPVIEEYELPVTRIAAYETEIGVPTQVVEFGGLVRGEMVTASFVKGEDGTTVSVDGDPAVLGVMSRQVVGDPADGWQRSDGGVGPVVIVEVDPVRECGPAFGL